MREGQREIRKTQRRRQFEDRVSLERRGHQPRNGRQPPEAKRGKESVLPQSLWRECDPADNLDFTLLVSRTLRD